MDQNDQKLLEVARRAAGVSKEQSDKDAQARADQKKKPKSIPIPNAQKWLDEVQRSKKVMKPFREMGERYMRYYEGDYSLRSGGRRRREERFDYISINIVYSHIEIITPSVFSGFPYIRVRPKPKVNEPLHEAEIRARNMELVINYWFKELAVDDALHRAFFDSFFGHTAVKLGWETEVIEKEVVYSDELGEPGTKKEMVTLKDRPFVERKDPWTVGFDPDARTRKECRWYWEEEIMHYNDFIASPLFTEEAKKKVKPQVYPIDRDGEKDWYSKEELTSEKKWVQVFTIWDKDTRQCFSVTPMYKKFLNSDTEEGTPWPYDIDYKNDPYPFAIHDAKTDRFSPYSWSEFRAYEAQIVELNRIRSAIQVHVKRSLPKYIYTDSFGNRHTVAKVVNARSDEAVKVDNLDGMRPLEDAKIPPDIYKFNEMSMNDMLNVSGLFEYQNQSIADTATEASLIEGRSQVRKNLRSRLWEQYVVEIAGKLSQLCQENMSTAIAVQIAGPQGVEWLNVSKEDIHGEFYFDIEPGIMEYKNEALRKQQLLKFAEITNNDPNVNRRAIVGKIAKELDMVPEDVMVPEDKLPIPEPPDPLVKFKEIDPNEVTNPELMNAIVLAACEQSNIKLPEQFIANQGVPPSSIAPASAPEKPDPGMRAASIGKDIAGLGMNPNGNPSLPAVEGNAMDLGNFSPEGI